MAEYREVCRIDEIENGRALGIDVNGLPIAIFRDGDSIYALLGRCPHQSGVMADGWIEDGEAVCPVHQWRFKLSTGRCTTIRDNSLHRFPCEVRDGSVWLLA